MREKTTSNVMLLAMLLTCAACDDGAGLSAASSAGEDAPAASEIDEAERALFLDAVTARGLDASSVRFAGGEAIVEGDLAFDVRQTLVEESQPRDKGYYRNKEAFVNKLEITVTDTTVAGDRLSATWSRAFETAVQRLQSAAEWKKLNIKWAPAGKAPADGNGKHLIVVGLGKIPHLNPIEVPNDPDAPDTTGPAKAQLSTSSAPGRTVIVNRHYRHETNKSDGCTKKPGDIDSLAFEQKVKTAIHEIGHTLGLNHPGELKHIPGTQQATRNAAPSYASIMWPGCIENQLILSSPSPDDVKSIQFLESD